LEVGEDAGRYFICMEYLEGQTLGRLLNKTLDAPLPLAARLELIVQVLEALAYMHAFTDPDGTPLSLVHRDISPNNIFITFDGTAKVLDFGVAKATGVSQATEAGVFKGKLGYAAPEQLLGNSEQRSDVFAVGVLLWELLAYRRLSQDRTQQEIMQARMAGVDPELMKKALGVPVELLQICMRAAAKRVEDRYASALEMRDTLRTYIRANQLEFSSERLRALLGDLYADERVEIRRLIDQRMKQESAEDDHSPLGTLGIPVAPAGLGGIGAVTLAGNASTYVQRAAPAGKGRWVAALVGVALVAGVAGRWLSGSGRSSPVTQASPVATPIVPSGARTAGAPPKLMTLKIAASPPDTEILLDGAKLDENPFTAQFPRDKALHRLELRSFGRVSEARMIRLDQDLDLLIALQVDRANQHKPSAAPVGSAGAKSSTKPTPDPAAPLGSASATPESAAPAVSAPATAAAPAVSAPTSPAPAAPSSESTGDARR
jgi:serine/threonine-protein kinase